MDFLELTGLVLFDASSFNIACKLHARFQRIEAGLDEEEK